jgi:hypothetical protein
MVEKSAFLRSAWMILSERPVVCVILQGDYAMDDIGD